MFHCNVEAARKIFFKGVSLNPCFNEHFIATYVLQTQGANVATRVSTLILLDILLQLQYYDVFIFLCLVLTLILLDTSSSN